jgi:hypothetical protein
MPTPVDDLLTATLGMLSMDQESSSKIQSEDIFALFKKVLEARDKIQEDVRENADAYAKRGITFL